MTEQPLVSIICLCYNHARFVTESLQSVIHQTYPYVELIVVDDASSDNSVEVIGSILDNHSDVLFIKNKTNIGNCRSFNKALAKTQGDYIIDLAADDVLLPHRVEEGVKFFSTLGEKYGVIFSDAVFIDQKGEVVQKGFYEKDQAGDIIEKVPQGNVFADVLAKYFFPAPTTMVRRKVLEQLNGYDETLAYEDFDLWVRASRYWLFGFDNQVLVQKRMLDNSLSSKQYQRGSIQMQSTYKVCKKALALCRSKREFVALRSRIVYECKHCIYFLDLCLAFRYIVLWVKSFKDFSF